MAKKKAEIVETPDETQEVVEEQVAEEQVGTEETQPEESSTSEEEASELTVEPVEEQPQESDTEKLRLQMEKMQDSMQKRIDELTYRAKSAEEQAKSSKGKTWDDLSVDELKKYRTYYRQEANDSMVDFLNDKIVEQSTKQQTLEQIKLERANAIRVNSWARVVEDYPELKDPNSEHYKKTVEVIQQNPLFDDIKQAPEGHAAAARLAAEELLRSKLTSTTKKVKAAKQKLQSEQNKLGLESGSGKQISDSPSTKLEKLRVAAENSGNPYSTQWRTYLKALDNKAQGGR